jgi:hypothetical protein
MRAAGVVAPPPPVNLKVKVKVLHLFSGPAWRTDSFAAAIAAAGGGCDDVDIVNTHLADQDILDDAVWCRIRARIHTGYYDVILGGPECGTFCSARRLRPGPEPLRSPEHPYGFPKPEGRQRGLKPEQFEQIRIGNLFAERMAEAAAIQLEAGRAFIIEQPAPIEGCAHMYEFASFKALIQRGAWWFDLDQCRFGAESQKPTRLLCFGVDLGLLEGQDVACDHPLQWVCDRRTRKWSRKPHLPLTGKRAPGVFATHAAAAYPALLNQWLAALSIGTVRKEAGAEPAPTE